MLEKVLTSSPVSDVQDTHLGLVKDIELFLSPLICIFSVSRKLPH